MSPKPEHSATIAAHAATIDVRHCALRIVEGPGAGTVLDPLPRRTLIGRHPWGDLARDEPRVSGAHCELLLARDQVRLRDLSSTNGVRSGNMRLFDALLEPGASFSVGDTTLRLESKQGTRQVPRERGDASGRLLGEAPSMQRLFDMLARVAPRELPVLLQGETGTGKTAVAEALHHQSPRRSAPFVAVNCGALPLDLVESSLFGHVKGAFTGAHRSAQGLFEQASGGTLLLDEIGELPLSMQPKLLSAIETRRVRPVGAEAEIPVDFRLVTATNRSLWDEVEAGSFRRDLYYRIAGLELRVPPLRERREDLAALAALFLARLAEQDPALDPADPPRLDAAAIKRLRAHSWPGNVRELQNVVARASVLALGSVIQPQDLLFQGWSAQEEQAASPAIGADFDADALYEGSFKAFKASLLAHHEQRYFRRLMERVQSNITRGAREAGISRTYLLTMLRRHQLYSAPE